MMRSRTICAGENSASTASTASPAASVALWKATHTRASTVPIVNWMLSFFWVWMPSKRSRVDRTRGASLTAAPSQRAPSAAIARSTRIVFVSAAFGPSVLVELTRDCSCSAMPLRSDGLSTPRRPRTAMLSHVASCVMHCQ